MSVIKYGNARIHDTSARRPHKHTHYRYTHLSFGGSLLLPPLRHGQRNILLGHQKGTRTCCKASNHGQRIRGVTSTVSTTLANNSTLTLCVKIAAGATKRGKRSFVSPTPCDASKHYVQRQPDGRMQDALWKTKNDFF